MGKAKAWCRTCRFLFDKLDRGRVVCMHPIMAAMHGAYPISEKDNCLLWERRSRKEEENV